MERHLWLGCDECRYGLIRCEQLVAGVAAALSVGVDRNSPSLAFKGSPERPNEDALAVLVQGDWLLLAVADGHRGVEASHTLAERLWGVAEVPTNPGQLGLLALALGEPAWAGQAGTTLLLVALDRAAGLGFGLSWGDSAAYVVGPSGVSLLAATTPSYVYAGLGPEPARGESFQFSLAADQALLMCTDGITECHYGSPLTSVTPDLMGALFAEVGPDAFGFARRVGQQAMQGVRGFPGGQDNLALIVVCRG